MSPNPDSELCSANFDKYLPWSLGLSSPYISIWISISTPGRVYSRSHATWRHGLQICPHRYAFVPGSREAMQCEVRALLRGTSGCTVKVLNPGLEPRSWSWVLHSTAWPTRCMKPMKPIMGTMSACYQGTLHNVFLIIVLLDYKLFEVVYCVFKNKILPSHCTHKIRGTCHGPFPHERGQIWWSVSIIVICMECLLIIKKISKVAADEDRPWCCKCHTISGLAWYIL